MAKNIVGLKELRENINHYISQVEKGKSFVVVRKSKPVFRISQAEEEDNWETVVDFTKRRYSPQRSSFATLIRKWIR